MSNIYPSISYIRSKINLLLKETRRYECSDTHLEHFPFAILNVLDLLVVHLEKEEEQATLVQEESPDQPRLQQ